ncbi:uncharacterized protein Hap1MRO34_010489 [Clarias gariepinus]
MMAVDGVIRVVVVMAVPLVALAWDYNFAESITSWLMPTGVNDGILKAVSGQGDIPVHFCEGVINSCCCKSMGGVIYCTGKSQSDQSSFLTDNLTHKPICCFYPWHCIFLLNKCSTSQAVLYVDSPVLVLLEQFQDELHEVA